MFLHNTHTSLLLTACLLKAGSGLVNNSTGRHDVSSTGTYVQTMAGPIPASQSSSLPEIYWDTTMVPSSQSTAPIPAIATASSNTLESDDESEDVQKISIVVEAVLSTLLAVLVVLTLWAGFRKKKDSERVIPAAVGEIWRAFGKRQEPRKGLPKHAMWTPEMLQKRWLFSLAGVFFAISVALGVLEVISRRYDGICDAHTGDHYLWTYAPTALFTVLAAVWTQVLYRAKQMQPWAAMAEGSKEASESVTRDYVSPWNPLVLFKALRRGHIVVAAAVLASLILQLLIVLSTGLLTLQTVENYTSEVPMRLMNTFRPDTIQFDRHQVDMRPAALVLGFSRMNLSVPAGTTSSVAYQEFSSDRQSDPDMISTQATVEVISSHMDCESADLLVELEERVVQLGNVYTGEWGQPTTLAAYVASWHPLETGSVTKYPYVYGASSPSCGKVSVPRYEASTSTRARVYKVDCRNSSLAESSKRLLIWVDTLITSDGTPRNSGAAIICTPFYGLRNLPVRKDRAGSTHVFDQNSSYTSTTPGFDAGSLIDIFQESVVAASQLLHYGLDLASGQEGLTVDYYWLWLNQTSPRQFLHQFQSAEVLTATFQRAWAAFTAQYFSLYFRHATNDTVTGTIMANKDRLVLRSVSFWLTEACLTLLCVLSCVVGCFATKNILPRDPSSIAGLATILSNSPDLQSVLQGTGAATTDQLQKHVSGFEFSIRSSVPRPDVAPSRIDCVPTIPEQTSGSAGHDRAKSLEMKWYQPLAASYFYKIGVPLLLLAVIITLEMLLRRSQARSGLAPSSSAEDYGHYLWTLLPAFFMTSLSWIIAAQYDVAKAFTPYSAISCGQRSAKASICRRPHSAFALWHSSRGLELYFVMPGLAVLFSTLLTIVVSGMFTAVPVPKRSAITLTQDDWFAPTDQPSSAPLQVDMVLNGNMSFPRYTYETLALSKVTSATQGLNGTVNAMVPSIRGHLNCTAIPPEQIANLTVSGVSLFPIVGDPGSTVFAPRSPYAAGSLGIHANLSYQGCSPHGAASTSRTMWFSDLEIVAPPDGYFGGLLWDLEGKGCPFAIGSFGEMIASAVTNITLFTCEPFTQKVMANATFTLPEMDLDLSRPPFVDESLVEPFEYQIRGSTMGGDPLRSLQTNETLFAAAAPNVLDGFMETLVYGSRGIPARELVGPANRDRLLAASDHLYGLAVAQTMDNFRVALHSPTQTVVAGTLVQRGSHRLVQSDIATHLLAGLLIFILVANTFTSWTMRTRKILPKAPYSIAAVASMLVGSDFLAMVQPHDQRMSDKQIQAKFEGFSFSMGWWSGAEGEVGVRRFSIDYGRAEGLTSARKGQDEFPI